MQPQNAERINAIELDQKAVDPLRIIAEHLDDNRYADTLQTDIHDIDEVLVHDEKLNTKERVRLYTLGSNLRLDWLYEAKGGQALSTEEFTEKSYDAQAFIEEGRDVAIEQEDLVSVWEMTSRLLDLRSLRVYRNAQEAQTTLAGTTEGKTAWKQAGSELRSIIDDSTDLMRDIGKYVVGKPGSIGKKAGGSLYEVMLTAYSRLEIYKQQKYGEVFVRSALEREDRHRAMKAGEHHRAFDIVVEGIHGMQLLQAASHHSKPRGPKTARITADGEPYEIKYVSQITQVEIRNFREVKASVDNYVRDFKIATNSVGNLEGDHKAKAAYLRLARTFGEQLDAVEELAA